GGRPGERRHRQCGGDHHGGAPGPRPGGGGWHADVREGAGAVAVAAHAGDGPEADDRSLVYAQRPDHPAQEQKRRGPGGPGRRGGAPAPDGRGPASPGRAGAGAPRQVAPGSAVARRRAGAGHAAQLNASVGIIGAGRAGVGLGLALAGAGYAVRIHGRTKKAVPRPLTLSVGPGDEPPPWIAQLTVIILAVPDDAIRPLAGVLADAGTIGSQQVVLHLSGVHGQEALGPLVGSRAALGSLHPLQTISDPERAAERLTGAWAAVEGMPRAVEDAERLAQAVGLR